MLLDEVSDSFGFHLELFVALWLERVQRGSERITSQAHCARALGLVYGASLVGRGRLVALGHDSYFVVAHVGRQWISFGDIVRWNTP